MDVAQQFKSELIEDHFTMITAKKERGEKARLSGGRIEKNDLKAKKQSTHKGMQVEPTTFSKQSKHGSTELKRSSDTDKNRPQVAPQKQ